MTPQHFYYRGWVSNKSLNNVGCAAGETCENIELSEEAAAAAQVCTRSLKLLLIDFPVFFFRGAASPLSVKV